MAELEDDFLSKTVNIFVTLREKKMKENKFLKMLQNSKVNYTKQMRDAVKVLFTKFNHQTYSFSQGLQCGFWQEMVAKFGF